MNSNNMPNTVFTIRKMKEEDLRWVREWYENFSVPGLPLADGDPVDLHQRFRQHDRYVVIDAKTSRPFAVFSVNTNPQMAPPVKVGFGYRQDKTEENMKAINREIKSWLKSNFPNIQPDIAFI